MLRGSYAERHNPPCTAACASSCQGWSCAVDAAGDVPHQQRGHQGVRGVRFEDLDAEPAGAGVGGGQRPVLDHRLGSGGRSDVERHQPAVPAGGRRPPPLDPLGQRIVRALRRHQGVGDARIGVRWVGPVHEPAAGHPAQWPAHDLRGLGPSRVGLGGLLDRAARDDEHVRRGGQERQAGVGPGGGEPGAEQVGGDGQPDVRAAVRVQVVPDDQPAVETGQPVGDLGYLGEQIRAGGRGQVVLSGCGGGHQQGAGGGAGLLQHAFPHRRPG